MITIVKTPKQDAVFLTENPLIIEIASTLTPDHFFKVFINVNGQEFDVQGWGKYNDTNCIIDLKQMFSDIFYYPFAEVTTTHLQRINELLKLVEVTVKEYQRADEVLVNTLVLPSFYVLHSVKSQSFNHTLNLQKLSVLSEVIRVSKDGVINLPIWITSTAVTVTITNNQTAIFSEIYTDLEKGLFVLGVNLSDFSFTTEEIEIQLVSGSDILIQKVNLQNLYLYTVSKLYVRNSFGVFEYIELFGALAETSNYKRKKYTLENDAEFIAKTTQTKKHKIFTGALFMFELSVLEAINNSEDIYYYKNEVFIPVVSVSKKSKGINTQENYIDDFIELQENGSLPIDNSVNYD